MYCVFGSITQMSASVTSKIWLAVRPTTPAKIELWFSSRKDAKAIAKISPRYLARSPISILTATKFMSPSPCRASDNEVKPVCVAGKDLYTRRGDAASGSSQPGPAAEARCEGEQPDPNYEHPL